MPMLQRFHLFKSPHGRKASAAQKEEDEPYPALPVLPRPHSALDSPRRQLDLDVRSRGNLTSRSVQYERTGPAPVAEAPRVDYVGSAVTPHADVPTVPFPAAPSTTPPVSREDLPDPSTFPSITPRRRQGSLLKTLAHHPSLSALRTKRSRAKSVAKAAAATTSIVVNVQNDAPESHPGAVPEAARTLKKHESQTGMSGMFRKRSLKGIRSLPRDIRLSQDSDKFRKLSNPPLHTLRSRLYTSAASHHEDLPPLPNGSQTAGAELRGSVKPIDFSTPEPVTVAMRFELQMGTPPKPRGGSEDVSPRRQAMGNLKHLSSPAVSVARLSSSPQRLMSKAELRTIKGSPPKQQKQQYGSISYGSPTIGKGGPLLGSDLDSVGSDERRHSTVDEALALLHASEPLPTGTPGGSQEQLRRGALMDGAKVQSGGLRFFSRDMIRSHSFDRMSEPSSSMARIKTTGLDSDESRSNPGGDERRHRSASPYEVALTPDVTKRMSLDAFGTPSPVKQSFEPESGDSQSDSPDQEWLEDQTDFPDIFEFVNQRPLSHSMPSFEATQLTPIEERSDVGTSSREVSPTASEWRGGAETPSHLGCYGRHSRNQSLASFHSASSSIPPVPALPTEPIATRDEQPTLRHKKHASAPPPGTDADDRGHNDQASRDQAMIEIQRVQISSLRESFRTLEPDIRSPNDHLSPGSQHALAAKDDMIVKLQTAMSENEEFCDKLQDAHDAMADRCVSLEEQNASLLSQLEKLSQRTPLPDPNAELRLKVLDRTNAELIRELATVKGENLDRAKKIAEMEIKHREAQEALSQLQEELSEAKRAAEEALKEKEESNAQAEAASEDLAQLVRSHQEEGKSLQVQLVEKDELICRLRERLATGRFENDETVVRLRKDIEALRSERDKARELAESRRARSEAAAEEKQEMQDELDRARRQYAQLEADFKSIIADGETIQNELQEERRSKELYKSDVADLMDDIQELEKDMEQKDQEIRDAQSEKANLMGMVQRAEEELADERSKWQEEKQSMLDMLAGMNSNESQELAETRDLADELTIRLGDAEDHAKELAAEVADLKERLETQQQSLAMQDDQLEIMKQDLAESEDLHARSIEESERRRKDAERAVDRLRTEMQELQDHISTQETALRAAVGEREMEKSRSGDVRSRLDAYLTEIDKLKMTEAKLLAQVDDLQKRSAADEIARLELEKKLEQAQEDKDLLNVALDSKQTELSLLQRQLGPSARSAVSASSPTKPRASTAGTSAGTPRTLRAPAVGMHTPVGQRASVPAATSGAAPDSAIKVRREASVHGPSSTPRAILARRAVLGSTTRHNQASTAAADSTPTKTIAMHPGKAGPTTPLGVARAGVPGVKKQSSLPVLARAKAAEGSSTPLAKSLTYGRIREMRAE